MKRSVLVLGVGALAYLAIDVYAAVTFREVGRLEAAAVIGMAMFGTYELTRQRSGSADR